MSELASVRTDDFSAVARHEGDMVLVQLKGNADYDAIDALKTLLQAIEAVDQRVTEVEVDFRELEFMNSSCLKNVVSWIGRVQELDPSLQYRVTFRSSAKLHWQKRSLNAMRCFASDLITIVEEP